MPVLVGVSGLSLSLRESSVHDQLLVIYRYYNFFLLDDVTNMQVPCLSVSVCHHVSVRQSRSRAENQGVVHDSLLKTHWQVRTDVQVAFRTPWGKKTTLLSKRSVLYSTSTQCHMMKTEIVPSRLRNFVVTWPGSRLVARRPWWRGLNASEPITIEVMPGERTPTITWQPLERCKRTRACVPLHSLLQH